MFGLSSDGWWCISLLAILVAVLAIAYIVERRDPRNRY